MRKQTLGRTWALSDGRQNELRWEFIKKNKKEREHTFDQESKQESDQEKKEVFSFFLGHFLRRESVLFFLTERIFFFS